MNLLKIEFNNAKIYGVVNNLISIIFITAFTLSISFNIRAQEIKTEEKSFNLKYTSLTEYHQPALWQKLYEIDSITNELIVHYKGSTGYQFNPVTTCQYGLACYDDFMLNKDSVSLTKFWNQVKSLIDNSQMDKKYVKFPYKFYLKKI